MRLLIQTQSEPSVIVLTLQYVLGRRLHVHRTKVLQNIADCASSVHKPQITLIAIEIRPKTYFILFTFRLPSKATLFTLIFLFYLILLNRHLAFSK